MMNCELTTCFDVSMIFKPCLLEQFGTQNFFYPRQKAMTNLTIDPILSSFLADEALTGLNIEPDEFWAAFESILDLFHSRNSCLLDERQEFQSRIDDFHLKRKGVSHNADEYESFLRDIGYIVPEGEDFSISTSNVDPEIACTAAPQLVVPISNARFSLNAANARWGSLYDALYGTDVIPKVSDGVVGHDPVRGAEVVSFAKQFLDETFPLSSGSFKDVTDFILDDHNSLKVVLSDRTHSELASPGQFVGYVGGGSSPLSSLLFKHNDLHVEVQRDRMHVIGKSDPAGIKDIFLEAAVTTIQDCEDSVAAVDALDKVGVYRNWLGLMRGDLSASFEKHGKQVTRSLAPDRCYTRACGEGSLTLPGRSVLLIRNVGHLMTTPAVLDRHGREVPEGIMDAMFTILIAKHDLDKQCQEGPRNSRAGSVYIVKPKMHGPKEVQFTCDLFAAVEEVLGVTPLTVKVGIMDEERRTTVNLKECIRVARDRVIFINTGFLDRTGDEIHTSMQAGTMIPRSRMKQQPWIGAYERWNVDTGLRAGFIGRAQIGKGMWAMPDEMMAMYNTKAEHPRAGANCAWVPSPIAAVLHALHYHQVHVGTEQGRLSTREKARLSDLLQIPVMSDEEARGLSADEIREEIENNAQGILGYVVRWVDAGVGCSKVPDVHNVGLMEDRATCRISSQYLANWLLHGLCTREQVLATMERMAVVVDAQNEKDESYSPMGPDFSGVSFSAACALALEGQKQPSGYTEPILHRKRREAKSKEEMKQ